MKIDKLPFRLSLFIILAIVITLLCGLVYVTVQQNYRLSANDPQIHISESAANMLAEGEDLNPFLPEKPADISKSLATFIIVYNDAGEATLSTANLDGATPNLPQGVLEYTKNNGQHRVTWEPKEGVRIAAVVTRYEKGYVLAGRSLREVEARIDLLTKKVLIAWLTILVVAFLGSWILIPKKSHERS